MYIDLDAVTDDRFLPLQGNSLGETNRTREVGAGMITCVVEWRTLIGTGKVASSYYHMFMLA
jgi:hypothetical protein